MIPFAIVACGRSDNASGTNPPGASASEQSAKSVLARPQGALAEAFNASREIVLKATTGEELAKVAPLREVTLTPAANRLEIVVGGTDSSVLLPAFVEKGKCVLQVVIDSPAETPIQLFYLTRNQPGYDEMRSQINPLREGRNVVYFQLTDPNLTDPLRLDPGALPGTYVIESLEARAVTEIAVP